MDTKKEVPKKEVEVKKVEVKKVEVEKDYRNYPRSPEPGKAPEPYAPTKSLAADEEALPDPTPPAFPIGTDPEVLADTDNTGGSTDQERMENKTAELVTPPHCPMCRGRGFIGGAVCPDCNGTGVDAASEGQSPVNTTPPALDKTSASLAGVVQCSQGVWEGATQYLYRWKADGVDIPSAVTAQHTVTVSDQGKSLTCAVTGKNATGEVTVLSSNSCSVAAVRKNT